jgi:hypothetical protein
MSNVFKVIDMIAKESLELAHEKATFVSTVNRQFDDSFKPQNIGGGRIGGTLRVKEPNQYTVRTGSRVMDVQDQAESTQTLTLATQYGVDMRFTSAELALDTNNPSQVEEFSKNFIEPAVSVLMSKIDGVCIETATKNTYNIVGTVGTVVGSSSGDITALGLARARLNQGLAPKDMNRSLQLDSVTMASIVNANKGLFMPEQQIKKAFTEGYYGRSAMADFYENERTYVHGVGSDVTGKTHASDAEVTDGGTSIKFAASSDDVNINEGDIFTVAGVYACHPETKASLGYLAPFVATAAGTTGAIPVSPAFVLTGAKQNVCSAAGAQLAVTAFNNVAVTFFGTANTSYRHNLMYHRDAFAFVMADMPVMDDSHKCVVKRKEGFSIRVWMASDIRNDELLCRLDCLYGFKTFRPAWSTRITN